MASGTATQFRSQFDVGGAESDDDTPMQDAAPKAGPVAAHPNGPVKPKTLPPQQRPERISDAAFKGSLHSEMRTSHIDRRFLASNFKQLNAQQKLTKTGRVAYQDPLTVPVGEWDPQQMYLDGGMGIIGATESGKSNWLAWQLASINAFPWTEVYTKTAANGFWQKYVPMGSVIQGYDVKRGNATLRHQAKVLPMADKFNIRMAIILDDLQGDKNWVGPCTNLYTMGRHFKVFCATLVQTKNGMHKHMRLNAKTIVVFRTLGYGDKEEIYEQWLKDFHKLTAVQLLSMYTADHHGLVIDTRTTPPKLYVTKAPDMGKLAAQAGKGGPFKVHIPLGSRAHWEAKDTRGVVGTSFRGDRTVTMQEVGEDGTVRTPPGGQPSDPSDITAQIPNANEERADSEGNPIPREFKMPQPHPRRGRPAGVRRGEQKLFVF